MALAVEFYLKAVFEALGARRRGHNIRDLFEKLPPDAQQKILDIHMKGRRGAKFEDYKDWMDTISNGFEEFRYSHEHQGLTYHKGLALGMITAMKQFISDARSKCP